MLYGYYDELPKPLNDAEIKYLLRLYKEEDSKEAFEELIVHNLLLIKHIIKIKFFNSRYDREDLFSVGIIGLMRAIKKYDYLRDTNFSLYIGISIEREIIKYLKKEIKHQANLSLNELVYQDSKNEVTFEENIKDLSETLEEEILNKEVLELIYKIILEIPNKKEREIMLLYFDKDNPLKQRDIAKMYGFVQSKVCRIIIKNLRYIKRRLYDIENKTMLKK